MGNKCLNQHSPRPLPPTPKGQKLLIPTHHIQVASFFSWQGGGGRPLKTRRKKKENQQRQTRGRTAVDSGDSRPVGAKQLGAGPVPDMKITEQRRRHAPALCHSRSRNAPRRPPPGQTGHGADLGRGCGGRAPGQRGTGLKVPTFGSLHRSGRRGHRPGPSDTWDRLSANPQDEGSSGPEQPPGSCRVAGSRQAQRGHRRTGPTGRPRALSHHQPQKKDSDLTTPLLPTTVGTKSQLLAGVTTLAPRAFHLRAFAPAAPSPETFLPRPHRTGSPSVSPPQRGPL